MRKNLTLLLSFLIINQLFAQEPASSQADLFPQKSEKKICTTPGIAFGLGASSNGYGADFGLTLNKRGNLIFDIEYKTGSYSQKDYVFSVSNQKLLVNADITLGHIGAFVDWHPFYNSLKLRLGYALINTSVNISATPKDSFKFGNLTLAPSEVGNIYSSIKFNNSAYLGVGLGRAVPKKRVGFTVEGGVYFIGKPNVTFKTTGLLEPTSSQEPIVQNALGGLQVLGYFNMALHFRLSGKYKN